MSDSHPILVWEVSTIAIPGQRPLERCEWNYGDVQDSERQALAMLRPSGRNFGSALCFHLFS